MVAVGGNDRIAQLDGRLHAHHHGFLADVEVAETADQPHAIELAGPLLEAADQQHVAIERFQLLGVGRRGLRCGRLSFLRLRGRLRHDSPSLVAGLIASRIAMWLI
jgi:hypothetical protein